MTCVKPLVVVSVPAKARALRNVRLRKLETGKREVLTTSVQQAPHP